jgi:hypothetical protein
VCVVTGPRHSHTKSLRIQWVPPPQRLPTRAAINRRGGRNSGTVPGLPAGRRAAATVVPWGVRELDRVRPSLCSPLEPSATLCHLAVAFHLPGSGHPTCAQPIHKPLRRTPPSQVPVESVPAPQPNLTIVLSFHVPSLPTDVSKLNGQRSNKWLNTNRRINAAWARESSGRRNQQIGRGTLGIPGRRSGIRGWLC